MLHLRLIPPGDLHQILQQLQRLPPLFKNLSHKIRLWIPPFAAQAVKRCLHLPDLGEMSLDLYPIRLVLLLQLVLHLQPTSKSPSRSLGQAQVVL